MKHRAEFLRVARDGHSRATPGVVVQVLHRPAPQATPGPVAGAATPGKAGTSEAEPVSPGIRFGITASRKVGNAVERNRVRRRLRAAAGMVLPAHGKPGCDYVLVGRRQTLTRPFTALLDDLRQGVAREAPAGRGRRPRADARSGGGPSAPDRQR